LHFGLKGNNKMAANESQIWKSARLTIERSEDETQGMVFRLSGPFTARDMYSSLSPDVFRNIFEPAAGSEQPSAHTFDLTEVPYMDSTALGTLTSHYVRCHTRGIRLTILGLSPRVKELMRITKMETVLPIAFN
jgi:anti-anti-sigma factor